MGTLYRKVTFEINDKNHDEIWLIGKSANFIFNPNTRNGEELFDFLSGCEETSDNSHQIEKLEADKVLYRKVAVSERKPIKSGTYFSNEEEVYYRESTKKFEHNYDAHCVYPQWWLEEVPNPTIQLQADKAELLEALENLTEYGSTGEDAVEMKREIESLIQKMKKCQENTPR